MCIDQCQNQLHLTNEQIIPNKVTCNPTDDTACDDELLSCFASYCYTSNHGSNYYRNQKNIHPNHFAFSTSDAKHSTNHDKPSHQIQTRSNYCPMLPPLENNHITKITCICGSLQPSCQSPVPSCKSLSIILLATKLNSLYNKNQTNNHPKNLLLVEKPI